MNTASLENSKGLYELSGWKVRDCYIQVNDPEAPIELLSEYDNRPDRSDYKVLAPAYDLGYLLRKLPSGKVSLDMVGNQWRCWYEDSDEPRATFADTPEDAACKLAIELWKAGVLK